MVIIGGKHSGNTKRLYQLCFEVKPSIHIETANELEKDEFKNINKVGITAGASTPQYIIDEVIETLKTF
jgi:4-hydroxy-3-methylbut-2-enyl diphosphate reductase